MTGLTKKEIENILADSQKLLQDWINFKKFLMKSFTQEPLSGDDEGTFLETKSFIAKSQRMVGEKVKDSFYYGSDKIQALTRQCISIGHLRQIPLSDRKALLVEWHNVYVIITRLAGALNFIKDGYVFKAKAAKGTSIAAVKAGASDKKKKGSGEAAAKFFKAIIILAVLGGAVFFLLQRMKII